jgi:tRNA 2-thiouridine synthesizing protein D
METTRTLTLAIMDAPYESAASTTALRLIDAVLRAGHHVNVFAYEGAVALTMRAQKPHANPIKGTALEDEHHPTTKDWVGALFRLAAERDVKLDWVNCGLCVDERGAGEWIDGPRRGGPKDFFEMAERSCATFVIPTR